MRPITLLCNHIMTFKIQTNDKRNSLIKSSLNFYNKSIKLQQISK
ncbi:hypothetical protein pb186bvf_010087 [Paramecium bursaria]